MDVNRHRVFVYGTLRRGGSNSGYMHAATPQGVAFTRPEYLMLNLGGYPALTGGDRTITGEVYLVNDATLARLDQLEGHPRYYRRREIELASPIGRAWCYIPDGLDSPERIPAIMSGDWMKR